MTAAPTELPVPERPAATATSVNLDQLRAARREGRGDALEVTNQGQVFRVPVELPVDAVEPLAQLAQLDENDESEEALGVMRRCLERGLAALFCTETPQPRVPVEGDELEDLPDHRAKAHADDCQWPRFLATRPSLDDELELWAALFGAYGVTLGEALASLDSSPAAGTPSKETLPARTGSTRGASGGGKRPAAKGKGARSSRR